MKQKNEVVLSMIISVL